MNIGGTQQGLRVHNEVYDASPLVLAWVSMTQPLISTDTLTVNATGTFTDGGSGKTLKTAAISLAGTGHVVAAVVSKKIKVYAVKLIVDAAISVNFRSGDSTALEGVMPLTANSGYVESVNPPAFLFATAAGEALDLIMDGAGNARGRVSYWDDDA